MDRIACGRLEQKPLASFMHMQPWGSRLTPCAASEQGEIECWMLRDTGQVLGRT